MKGFTITVRRKHYWKCRYVTLRLNGNIVSTFDVYDDGSVSEWTPGRVWESAHDGGVPFFDY